MEKVSFVLLCFVLLATSCFALSFSADVAASASTENTWETKSPLTKQISGPTVTVNNNIYIFYNNDYKTFVYTYNPETQVLAQRTVMPTYRSNYGIAVVDDKIYTIGGQHNYRMPDSPGNYAKKTNVTEVYNTQTSTWETKSSTIDSSSSLLANVVDGKIYAMYQVSSDRNVDVYDPETDTWTRKTTLPSEGSPSHTCVIDDKIYALQKESGRLHSYDTKSNSWTSLSHIQVYGGSRMVATTGEHAPKQIYLVGGYIEHGFGDQEGVTTVYRYDPVTDSWSRTADMPTARYNAGVGVYKDRIYVIGGALSIASKDGWTGTQTTSVEVYTPFGYSETPLVTNTPPATASSSEEEQTDLPTEALIAGAVVAATVVAVSGVVVYHLKHAPAKSK
jgi:N-acetylneuraminic acid mutarotase